MIVYLRSELCQQGHFDRFFLSFDKVVESSSAIAKLVRIVMDSFLIEHLSQELSEGTQTHDNLQWIATSESFVYVDSIF